MDEDPRDHDFDQRHDGPFESAAPPLTMETRGRQDSSKSEPAQEMGAMSPVGAKGEKGLPTKNRKSVQLPRYSMDARRAPRTSMTISPSGRPSRDFDTRRDGPYGRPSLTMTRRSQSGITPIELAGTRHERDEAAPDLATLEALPSSAEGPIFQSEPPPLNYSLWERKWYIALFWGLILIDVIAQPLALYFGLWYGTDLSPNTVFSIITAALGGVSIFEYFMRFWRLWKKNSNCRVIGARRMYLDWFHWNFTLGWVIIMIELIVGTIPEHPPIRLLAMPLASMLYAFGTELLIVDTLRFFQVPAPVRISSIPKGAQLRPAIYSIIEDIVAVDGSGGTAYREALNRRYESSHVFRSMLRRMGAFWAFGAEAMAVVTTILIFTIQHEAAYCVGWSAPFLWAAIWTAITIWYVKRKLREEKKAWQEEIAEKQGTIALSNQAPSSEAARSETGVEGSSSA